MTTPQVSPKNASLVDRLVGLLASKSLRWHNLAQPCAYPDCRRRSVQYSFARRLDGIEIGGQWLCSPPCYEAALLRHFTSLVMSRKHAPRWRKARIPLGLMFLSRGELTHSQLNGALEEHRSTGERVGDVLLRKNYVTEQQVTAVLAAQWGHPTFPSNSPIAWLPFRVPIHLIELHRIVPLHFIEASRTLLLGFADGPDHRILPVLQRMLKCSVDPCFVTMSEFNRRLKYLKTEKTMNEVVFDRESPPAEMAQVSRSYISQSGSRWVNFSLCGDHLWVRLASRKQDVDLLFRTGSTV